MVLVPYILDNYVRILQTQFSYREGHEARRRGLEAMPLDQHIEGGHGECEPRLKILPHAVHPLLEMADQRQHGEHRLDEQTVLPLAARTQFEVAGIPLRGMEAGITEDNHAFFELPVVSRLFGNRLAVEHEQFFQRPDVIRETCRHGRSTLLPFASLRLTATHPSSQCTVRLDKVVDGIVQIDMPLEEVHIF